MERFDRDNLAQIPRANKVAPPVECQSPVIAAPTNGVYHNGIGSNGSDSHAAPAAQAKAAIANPTAAVTVDPVAAPEVEVNQVNDGGLSQQLAGMTGDAPFCDV